MRLDYSMCSVGNSFFRRFAACAVVFGLAAVLRAAEVKKTVVFFGDSLTAGYGLDNPGAEAYPALIQKKIDASGRSWRAVNAGLSGETTAAGLRRVDWILRQPVDLFFLALGGNDGLRGIDPKLSENNLAQIIAHVRQKYPKAKIIVAGMEMPPGMGEDYVRQFRAIFPAVAEATHATLLRFLLEGVAGRPDLNQPDGIHPTAAGHAVIADHVWKTLQPLL
jgi:acyl-CoA thioesterase I